MTENWETATLDLDQLDADLYRAIQALEKQNYGRAQALVWTSWGHVRRFRLATPPLVDDGHLPATTDRHLQALAIKALYWLRNRRRLPCRNLGFRCEWVYPYGWVPEGGCPYHD